MLVSDITRKARRLFGDTSDQIVINQTDFYDWINEAQLLNVRKTHCLTNTVSTAASSFPLTLPADWVITKRVTYDTAPELPLKLADIEDLDAYSIDPTYVDSPTF